jgi:hypothetical protein
MLRVCTNYFRIVPAKCFSPWGVAFQRTTAVDAWNSPERLTPRPGIQIRSNRRRFSGCAALDDTDNCCRQYDEVKERNHWYQEKPNCVHISTSFSIFGRPRHLLSETFNAFAKDDNAKAKNSETTCLEISIIIDENNYYP